MFKKNDVVVAKNEYLEENETVESTIGIVVDYNEENDYLQVGTIHPQDYAIPPIFNACGEFYRLATDTELKKWGIA